jgi:hypothetical protein
MTMEHDLSKARRISSHMSEKDWGVPLRDRWSLFKANSGPEHTFADIRGRYYAIGAGLIAAALTVNALVGGSDAPAPDTHPTTTYTPMTIEHSLVEDYESCLRGARLKLATDPAAARIAIQHCQEQYAPLFGQEPSVAITQPQS